MTEDKKSGEDSDFDFEPVDDIKLIPIIESPIKLTPTKRVERQITPSKNRYTSPKLFRNDLNRPKISAKKLNPILENGTTLHSQTATTSTNRVSLKFKSPSSSVASYSRKIDASPYKMSSPSKNITSIGSNTHQRHSLISKMKTKSESNKFCPIYDIDKIMVGKKMLGNEYTKEFKQLKYTNDEFHMLRSTSSGYDNDGDVVIKKGTITEFYFSDDSTHAIYMNLKRVPKEFPCASDVRIFSKDPIQKGIIFYLSKNIDIPSSEIDKFKEIFNDRWVFINITNHIFNSLLSYDDSTKHKSPESPTHKDDIISNFVENGNNSDNISICGSQPNDMVVEISSSPTDKLNEGNSSKQHSEIDIENDTQASTPNDTNCDVKVAPLQSPNSKLTSIDKTPTKSVGGGSVYSIENVFKTSSPTSTSSQFTPRRSSRISQRPISPDFNADITRWIAEVSSLDNVLTYRLPNNKAITIHGDDLQRLKSGIFLNDTLIEFYSQWLLANYRENDEELNDETYIANPFFYAFIQNDQFERVRKWTSKVDLFKKEYVFIPINENLHWYLALILNLPNYDPLKGQPNPKDPKKEDPVIIIFDSLFLKHRKTFEQLEQFLLEEYKFRNPEKFKKSKTKETEEEGDSDDIFYLPKLTIHAYAKVPGQDNFSDCGVYLLYYLKTILSSPLEQKNQLLTDRTLKINFECSMKGMRREIVEKIHDLTKENQGYHGLLGLIDDVDNDVFKSQKSTDNGVGEDDDDDLIMED